MPKRTLVVTGSSGLIGAEMVTSLARDFDEVHGIDNNQRAVFFGPHGDTSWNRDRLRSAVPNFVHHDLDVRDRQGVGALIRALRPAAVVHAAAQPSHDRAADIPFDDFDTNATGTLNLLQACRESAPEAPFVHLSTNKVYGDAPNAIPLREDETRWEFADPAYAEGIPESFTLDRSTHSLFGASKLAADILVQEYGRYFGMPTCALRCGCLTGPGHSGVQLHGFLSYLVKCNLERSEYTVIGYKGKQVRDNLHALDVAAFARAFIAAPRSGDAYNLGGGKANSCSILEAFALVERHSGQPQRHRYVETPRVGDHICYYSDLRKVTAHYPDWHVRLDLDAIVADLVASWRQRMDLGRP